MKPGQDLVLVGWAGLAGSLLLLKHCRDRFEGVFSAGFLRKAEALEQELSKVPEAELLRKMGVTALELLGEGGIFAALWRMADRFGIGLELQLSEISLRQETVELCEVVDCNPYELYAGGALLLAADQGGLLVRELKEQGIRAAVIGAVTGSKDRALLTREGRRFVTKPQPDSIYGIIGKE